MTCDPEENLPFDRQVLQKSPISAMRSCTKICQRERLMGSSILSKSPSGRSTDIRPTTPNASHT
jgi:hypothetical protein